MNKFLFGTLLILVATSSIASERQCSMISELTRTTVEMRDRGHSYQDTIRYYEDGFGDNEQLVVFFKDIARQVYDNPDVGKTKFAALSFTRCMERYKNIMEGNELQ